MLEMNKTIRSQWTAALRSGKYPQGKYDLRNNEGFCCLGVLCELAREAGVVKKIEDDSGKIGYDGGWSVLPKSVMKWADLDQELPYAINSNGDEVSLATLNDNEVPFSQIADLIDGGNR